VVVGLKKKDFTPRALGVCVRTIKLKDKDNVICNVKKITEKKCCGVTLQKEVDTGKCSSRNQRKQTRNNAKNTTKSCLVTLQPVHEKMRLEMVFGMQNI